MNLYKQTPIVRNLVRTVFFKCVYPFNIKHPEFVYFFPYHIDVIFINTPSSFHINQTKVYLLAYPRITAAFSILTT